MRDEYCDGLGDCLPTCPCNAISFVKKDTLPYDEIAVKANIVRKLNSGCASFGSMSETIKHYNETNYNVFVKSQLRHWPVQIKLAPVNAPYFEGADLLIAADCTAYAYGNFHRDFIKDKLVLIGCPKLDNEDYSRKLSEIIAYNSLKSITVVRMEVPCCGGIEYAVSKAVTGSGRSVPMSVVTISTEGKILG